MTMWGLLKLTLVLLYALSCILAWLLLSAVRFVLACWYSHLVQVTPKGAFLDIFGMHVFAAMIWPIAFPIIIIGVLWHWFDQWVIDKSRNVRSSAVALWLWEHKPTWIQSDGSPK